MNNQYKEKP